MQEKSGTNSLHLTIIGDEKMDRELLKAFGDILDDKLEPIKKKYPL